MSFGWLTRWMRRKVCPECNHDCDRLERAQALHVMSVDAVKAARRKQARRLSDVRITVEATLRQMEERAAQREGDRS
ncbi:hypothetical protein MKK55_13050 [Methylobacterium sp. J-059]|uniref:hypothetical protein n=1 Tax=unclassified Methylobacterium TaxID=2615210 RepID=UPI001FB92528|nr:MULTISPECIES: hypothetical protein [unclassified Methylobacterium]MCJ2009820.1 hypothetical protein [Methylobacterium sp. J-092]MCJ2039857.1 hypothetical protein [Methylobacterium sp. J-059]